MTRDKNILEKVASAPAEGLEIGMETGGRIIEKLPGKKYADKVRNYWHTLGPGLTTGASDDDPSGIGTYSQTGAQYGFQLLWLAAFT